MLKNLIPVIVFTAASIISYVSIDYFKVNKQLNNNTDNKSSIINEQHSDKEQSKYNKEFCESEPKIVSTKVNEPSEQDKIIETEFKLDNQDIKTYDSEIDKSITFHDINKNLKIENDSSSKPTTMSTTATSTTTTTTTTTTIINNQKNAQLTSKKVQMKYNVSSSLKKKIRYSFIIQSGGIQEKQQKEYQLQYEKKLIKGSYRNEILITGYTDSIINEKQIFNLLRDCKIEAFIYGPSVTYIKLFDDKDFEFAVSLNGIKISKDDQLTIINYKGGFSIERSNIICYFNVNGNCNKGINCVYSHKNTTSVQECFHPSHFGWWFTIPYLNTSQFGGKGFPFCKNCYTKVKSLENTKNHKGIN